MPRYTPSHDGGRSWGSAAIALVAVAGVLVIGGVAGAVTMARGSHGVARGAAQVAPRGWTVPGTASFTAVANVTPPVAATGCTAPSTFTYAGTLSATAPGTVRYQWVYSSGKPGPVQTVTFTAAGHRPVTGGTVTAKTAGGGWGELKVISPVALTSGKAAYKLLCGGSSVGGVTVTAAVTPAAQTASCATAVPSFTATGSIEASKAEAVSYYWAQSNGTDSAPAVLTFTGPGTLPAAALKIRPPAASGSGEAVLVVTSPVAAASAPATYTLTCKAPPASATGGPTHPASSPAAQGNPPTTPAGSPTTPVSNPTTPQGNPSTPASAPSTAQSSPPPPQNAGGLALSNSLGETVSLGSSINIGANASGGTTPYTWTEAGLPSFATATSGGAWNAAFSILGTANAAGTYPFTVTLSDSAGDSVTGHYTLTVLTPNNEQWTVKSLTAQQAVVGTPYSGSLGVTGQTSGLTVTYAITSGSLPPGLSLDQATGAVTGTPTQTGFFFAYIVVTDVATGATKQGGAEFTVYAAGTAI